MQKDGKIEILYSDQVREIISKPPVRIIRWGTVIVSAVFALFLLLAWVIKYPDIIPAPIEITTANPPVTLASKITGRINILYVTDGRKVASGTLLAVMETAASIDEIRRLSEKTDSADNPSGLTSGMFPRFSQLGELQPFYASFLRALSDHGTYISNDIYSFRINSASDEIAALVQYIERLGTKEKLLADNLRLEANRYRRDSLLYLDRVLSESDWENSRQAYNQGRLSLQEVRLEQSAKSIDLASKRQALQDFRILREEERQKLESSLFETWQNLKAEIRIWQNKYLLISPIDGQVTFTKFWSENQSVTAGEPVLSIVPEDPGEYIGRIRLSMQRSGKVTTGREVNIKLSGYPYLEYGMVRGLIRSKSLVPSGDLYIIEVSLPDGLETLYGTRLEFNQNMQGTAEIVTDNLRLLQKIINPLRHLAVRNRNL